MLTGDKDMKKRVATVGTFDGLHKGHRRVLEIVKREAGIRDMEPLVICFDRHPLETVAPHKAPGFIQSPSERTNELYREGFALLTLEFSLELSQLSAAQWMRKIHEEQGVEVLVVGYDNTFGCDGTKMNLADYRKIGREMGMEVIEAPYEPHASSSAIRHFLTDGSIDKASAILGRPFKVAGEVVPGKRLGASIGFPTANLHLPYRAHLPGSGVYEVEVTLPSGESRKAVANIGVQPTVAKDAPVRFEVHIPGFRANLYGSRLEVKFIRRLRDEMKFDSVEDLKKQISLDIEAIK